MENVITADEVKKHNTRKKVWMVYRNEVYDVTAFLEEHPGGEEPLLESAGQDATIAFDDVGHSADAIAMMKKYKIGVLASGQGCSQYHRECTACDASRRVRARPPPPPPESSSKLKWALLALGLAIIIGVSYKKYSSG